MAGTYSVTGNTTLNNGMVTFAGNASTVTATFNGGVLAGSGTVTVSGFNVSMNLGNGIELDAVVTGP